MSGDIVIPGDSIAGVSDAGAWSAGQGFGALICARAGRTEVNLSASGAKLADMQSQTDAACARNPKPVGVAWMMGTNDVQAGTDVSAFQADLDGQVAQYIDAGIPLTLLTTFPRQIPSSWFTNAPPYIQAIRSVAAKYRVKLIDIFAMMAEKSLTLSSTDYAALFYTGDGINAHPTALGQQLIASQFSLPQAMGSAAYYPPILSTTVWSDSANTTISSDGRTATCATADKGARSNNGKSSGKWFFPLIKNTGGNNLVLGIGKSSSALDYPGRFNDGALGYWTYNGTKIQNDIKTVLGPAIADGSKLYGYLDLTDPANGKLWFGNPSGWFGSGNPETGANPAFSGLSGTFYLMMGTTNASPASSVTIDTSDDAMRGSASLWAAA